MHIVRTQDVDCGSRRAYKTLAAAARRFEEMSGLSPQAAIDYNWPHDGPAPSLDRFNTVRHVSDFGTVVILEIDRKLEGGAA